MLDSQSLADFSSEIVNTAANPELEQRLGLYRVFLKLYEHHRGLLNEILELEFTDGRSPNRKIQYVQGVIRNQQVCLITNLLQSHPVSVLQPQNLWVMGRDRKCALQFQDNRLSRRHAAIQYIEGQGFYLIDFKSTNGTFINGEPMRQAVRLRDGDQIRLGSLVFYFFICSGSQMADPVSAEWLEQTNAVRKQVTAAAEPDLPLMPPKSDKADSSSTADTSMFRLDQSSPLV